MGVTENTSAFAQRGCIPHATAALSESAVRDGQRLPIANSETWVRGQYALLLSRTKNARFAPE
jgi:hypothetical protein